MNLDPYENDYFQNSTKLQKNRKLANDHLEIRKSKLEVLFLNKIYNFKKSIFLAEEKSKELNLWKKKNLIISLNRITYYNNLNSPKNKSKDLNNSNLINPKKNLTILNKKNGSVKNISELNLNFIKIEKRSNFINHKKADILINDKSFESKNKKLNNSQIINKSLDIGDDNKKYTIKTNKNMLSKEENNLHKNYKQENTNSPNNFSKRNSILLKSPKKEMMISRQSTFLDSKGLKNNFSSTVSPVKIVKKNIIQIFRQNSMMNSGDNLHFFNNLPNLKKDLEKNENIKNNIILENKNVILNQNHKINNNMMSPNFISSKIKLTPLKNDAGYFNKNNNKGENILGSKNKILFNSNLKNKQNLNLEEIKYSKNYKNENDRSLNNSSNKNNESLGKNSPKEEIKKKKRKLSDVPQIKKKLAAIYKEDPNTIKNLKKLRERKELPLEDYQIKLIDVGKDILHDDNLKNLADKFKEIKEMSKLKERMRFHRSPNRWQIMTKNISRYIPEYLAEKLNAQK